MIIFLCGEDTYRSSQKLNEIIEQYKKIHKSGLNFKIFDLLEKQISYQNFKDEFKIFSMFKEKKFFVLKNVFLNLEFKEGLLNDIKYFKDSEYLILIYEKEKIRSNDALLKKIKKSAKIQEFNFLERQKLKSWIQKELEKYRSKIKPDALSKFIVYTGNDLWQVSEEVKKLAAYKKGEIIEINDIELLVRPKIETDIFKTIDFIAAKDKKNAFQLLKKHIQKGDSPLYLLSMINFQFRNLLTVKDLIEKQVSYSLIPQKAKIHPFVVKKSFSQCQKFTLNELKKIYLKIFQTDINIKTGRIDPQTALDLLITEI